MRLPRLMTDHIQKTRKEPHNGLMLPEWLLRKREGEQPPVASSAAGTDPARDLALTTVLDRLTGGALERRDLPDGWVTAIRRLPARGAEYAPFPDAIDERLRGVLEARGIDRLYTHQAQTITH